MSMKLTYREGNDVTARPTRPLKSETFPRIDVHRGDFRQRSTPLATAAE
jgi:hypothetical protein